MRSTARAAPLRSKNGVRRAVLHARNRPSKGQAHTTRGSSAATIDCWWAKPYNSGIPGRLREATKVAAGEARAEVTRLLAPGSEERRLLAHRLLVFVGIGAALGALHLVAPHGGEHVAMTALLAGLVPVFAPLCFIPVAFTERGFGPGASVAAVRLAVVSALGWCVAATHLVVWLVLAHATGSIGPPGAGDIPFMVVAVVVTAVLCGAAFSAPSAAAWSRPAAAGTGVVLYAAAFVVHGAVLAPSLAAVRAHFAGHPAAIEVVGGIVALATVALLLRRELGTTAPEANHPGTPPSGGATAGDGHAGHSRSRRTGPPATDIPAARPTIIPAVPSASAPGAVEAVDLGSRNGRQWAFRHLDLQVPGATVVAVHASRDRHRVPLLLTLAGRLPASEGTARVGGIDVGRHRGRARQLVGLGEMRNVNDLDPSLRICDLVRERLALAHGPARLQTVGDVMEPVGLDADPSTAVDDLGRLHRLLLGTALALVGSPPVVALEAVDAGLTHSERDHMWSVLAGLALGGTTVIAGCVEPGPATVVGSEIRL